MYEGRRGAQGWTPVVLAVWLWSAGVQAHDPPQARDVIWSNDGRAVVVTNRGLILGAPPDGESRILCIEALGLTASQPARAAWTADGGLLVAGYAGLQRSTDEGCSFEPVEPFEGLQVTAMAAPHHATDRVFVAIFDAEAGGVYRSDDGAGSFTRVLPLGDDDWVYSMAMAPGDPETIYASGWQFGTDMGSRYLRRSDDGGATWERFELSLTADEEHAEIVAIHPTDARTLVLRSVALDPTMTLERVLLSDDGGASFEELLQLENVRGGSYADGGRELWVAARAGLWRSRDMEAPSPVNGPEEMSCVQADGDLLLACGHYEGVVAGHDGLGALDATAQTFAPWLDFAQVVGPIDCPETSRSTIECIGPWLDWEREVGTPVDAGVTSITPSPSAVDGGTPPAAAPAPVSPDPAPPSTAPPDSGGCRVAAGAVHASTVWPWLALGLTWLACRRRHLVRA